MKKYRQNTPKKKEYGYNFTEIHKKSPNNEAF